MEIGQWVKFTGATVEQTRWGNNDDPHMLVVGQSYQIEKIDTHSWHTKLTLRGITGKFNSVCFEE